MAVTGIHIHGLVFGIGIHVGYRIRVMRVGYIMSVYLVCHDKMVGTKISEHTIHTCRVRNDIIHVIER